MKEKSSPDSTIVQHKLAYWSQQLHDLSGRNRLLYYRDTKSSTATILSPGFLELFRLLVDKGSKLTVPVSDALEDEPVMAVDEVREMDLQAPPELKPARGPHDLTIQTNRSTSVLNRVLYNLRYLSRTVWEEQGFNILYLTFGMLKWKEVHDRGFNLAPLVLVPVRIERKNPNSPYTLSMAEDDIVVNPILQIKLAKDFGFQLPEVTNDLSGNELVGYLSAVAEQVARFHGWEVTEAVTLGAFNFLTLLLIKDFENNAALYCQHPIVRALCGVENLEFAAPEDLPEANELDDRIDPGEVYQVLDADSSQQEAIEAAKRGLSFVLQGPPGTGKSQTIANIIVESIAAGKKVLFVSQKMAALEVVENRLSRRGLKEFCLEIHSHRMDKRRVIHDLMDTLSDTATPIHNPHYQFQQQELKQIRDELNAYVRQLHEPRFELKLSLYQAQGRLAHFLDAPQLSFSVADLESMTAAGISSMIAMIRKVSAYPKIIREYGANRWTGYRGSGLTLEGREGLAATFSATARAVEDLHWRIGHLASTYKLPAPETIQDSLDYLYVFACFNPGVFSPDLAGPIERHLAQPPSAERYFDTRHHEDMTRLRSVYRKGVQLSDSVLFHSLVIVRKIASKRDAQQTGEAVDYHRLPGNLSELDKDKNQIADGFDQAGQLFVENAAPAPLRRKYNQLPEKAAAWFDELAGTVGELSEWENFNSTRQECERNGLGDFVEKALASGLPAGQWEPAFMRRFYLLLVEKLVAGRPLLQKFKGTTQTELIRRFRDLDLAMIENSSREIRAKLYEEKPQWSWMKAGSAETSILRRESSKKRRVMSLRRLFHEIPNLIQALKPCLMVSPLTVCQLLVPSIYEFDMVVFDEASQIPPEYAVSAFLRARQVIVAGDSQQLPPTNFFQMLEDGSSEDEEGDPETSFESILDACDSCGFPNKMLNWHYRSKDESLIAYSNLHFYENRLHTFPNPSLDNPSTGLKFVFVEDGIYQSGLGARYNVKEARKVAELIREHLLQHPELSLGVVAFSAPQRRMIEAELEKLRLENPELNSRYATNEAEPVFIKNLENVQGDERDVILLSVGYGKDEAGKMALNFGPINRDGGARRLNVAVTRARYQLKLVASIQPEDIDLARATSQGAQLLREYLEAARDGVAGVVRQADNQDDAQFSSLFEESVFNELSERGVQLATQVGVSQYRIDLAVLDAEHEGRYLLGIECDGPMYRSAMTARDRDRLRQQVLEGLGWKIHRIWSRDWVQHREEEVEKVLAAIRARKEELAASESEEGPVPARPEKNRPAARKPQTSDEGREEPDDLRMPPGAMLFPHTALELKRFVNGDSLLDTPISNVIDAFQAIAIAEGPVSTRVAKSLVLEAWNARRGKRADERLEAAISHGEQQKAFAINGEFIWPAGMQVSPLRVHLPGQPVRPIKEIAPEEIEVALRECVRGALTIAREDLVKEACRLFGLRATAENAARVDGIVTALLAAGEFELEKGKIRRGNNF